MITKFKSIHIRAFSLLTVFFTLIACGQSGPAPSASGTSASDGAAASSGAGSSSPGAWSFMQSLAVGASANATSPALATNSQGVSMAVWVQSDGTQDRIWARRYTAAGWEPPQVIESNANPAYPAKVGMDTAGNALVVWRQNDAANTGTDIWAAYYHAGTGWQAPSIISHAKYAGLTTTAADPVIAMDGNGNAFAMWSQSDNGTVPFIWTNHYVFNQGWGTATEIASGGTFTHDPQIATDNSGSATAVWLGEGGAFDYVNTARYTPGSGWGVSSLTVDGIAGTAHAIDWTPQVAMDGNGNAIAVWSHATDTTGVATPKQVYASLYSTASGWGALMPLQTSATQVGASPQVSFDSSGNAWVLWEQNEGAISHIWGSQYASGAWNTAQPIETSGSDAHLPQVAIWGASSNGSAWNTAQQVENENGDTANAALGIDAAGQGIAVWQQQYLNTSRVLGAMYQ